MQREAGSWGLTRNPWFREISCPRSLGYIRKLTMLGPFQCGKNGFSWRECFTAYIPNATPIITASNRLAHPSHTSRNQTSGLWFFLEVIHHSPDVEVPKCWSWPTCQSQGTPWLISKSVWFERIEPHPPLKLQTWWASLWSPCCKTTWQLYSCNLLLVGC